MLRDKNIPLTMTAIENNINDIAGVRIICSFLDDIYTLADCLRRSERSDCGCKGVPDLLRVVAHALPGAFCGAGGNRSLHRRSQRTRRPARHRRDVFVCLYAAPELSAGLSLSKACRRGWKGKHPLLLAFTQAIP